MTFEIGKLAASRSVANLMQDDPRFCSFLIGAFARYRRCDWGEMTAHDKAMNDAAVKDGNDRILAAYEHSQHPDWRLWIITESDRSYTTILFPDEY